MDIQKLKNVYEHENTLPETVDPKKEFGALWIIVMVIVFMGAVFLYQHLERQRIAQEKIARKKTPEALYTEGAKLCQQGNFTLAYTLLSQALEQQPNLDKARIMRAKASYRPHPLDIRYDKFYGVRHNSFLSAPQGIPLQLPPSQMQNVLGTILDDLDKWIELHPQDPVPLFYRGYICAQDLRNDEAIAFLKKAVDCSFSDNVLQSRVHSSLGLVYTLGVLYQKKLTHLAHKHFNKAIALYPRNATAYHHHALLYYDEKNYVAAKDSLDKAIEYFPQFKLAVYHRGIVLMKLKKWQDAASDLQRAYNMVETPSAAYPCALRAPQQENVYFSSIYRSNVEWGIVRQKWEYAFDNYKKWFALNSHDDAFFRHVYDKAITNLSTDDKIAFLVLGLKEGGDNLKVEALTLMKQFGENPPTQIIDAIVNFALKYSKDNVREMGFVALQNLKVTSHKVVDAAVEGLEDRDADVHFRARDVLLNDHVDIKPHVKTLLQHETTSQDPWHKMSVAEILIHHNLETTLCIEILHGVLQNGEKYTMLSALKILQSLYVKSSAEIQGNIAKICAELRSHDDEEVRDFMQSFVGK